MILFLTGMMGTGKTYWAQRISANHNIDWTDLDAEIEKENMMTIQEIFETEGEPAFRIKESNALHKLASYQNIIIATGGGTPCFHNNMQWMNEHGITIWIDEPIDDLVERAMRNIEHRPAIKGMTANEVEALFKQRSKERKSFYEQSKYHLHGDTLNAASFAKIIQQYA